MKRFLIAFVAVGFLAVPGAAQAAPITFTNFTPQGSWALVDNGVVGGLESVTLYFDPTGYVNIGTAATDYIFDVAVKVSSALGTGSSLASTTAPGTWTFHMGGLNSNGCSGSGSGFACASDGSAALVTTTPMMSWTFLLDLNGNPLLTGTGANGASIKAQFRDASTSNGNILSQNITLQTVPEPTSLILLGTGLIGAAALTRRRRRA